MSGETASQESAWTVDSLRIHVLELIAEKDDRISEHDRRYEQRFESQEKAIQTAMAAYGAAVALASERSAADIVGLRDLYDAVLSERDERYAQRAAAMEKAHDIALANVIKEFGDRIDQVRSETVLAMSAAEKAISKAETATERRFESVNEFRAQQADIIQTFARKTEVDTRLIGLTEKVDGCQAQAIQIGAMAMPRNEYDRAHTDLAERVIQVEKALAEKMEAQAKTLDARIALLQSQLSTIEAITR